MAEQQWSRNNFRITPNAEPVPIEIVGSSTFGRYNKIASGLTYNMYISDGWLVNFAGYKRAIELVSGNIGQGRGLFHSIRGQLLIAVVGTSVFQINNNLTFFKVGDIVSEAGEVFMDENLNNQICIVDGLYAYIYNYVTPSGIVQQTSVSADIQPSYVCFHNTYFLFGNQSRTNNGALWYAYVYDPAGANQSFIKQQTQFALSTKPDYAIAVRRLPGQANNVLVFGTTVCEIWTQVGGTQNYRRNSSVNIDYGCLSVSTIGSCEQYTAWLAVNENNSPIILVYSQGSGLKRISTDGIDYLMDSVKHPDQSTAIFYTQDGHLFYQLTFYNPVDNLTLVYDFNTEKFFNLSDQGGDFHPARQMVYFNGYPYFVSLDNASLYVTDTNITVYNENLTSVVSDYDPQLIFEIPRTRICESIRKPDSGRFIVNSFVFTMEQGQDEGYTGASEHNLNLDYIVTEAGIQFITEGGDPFVTEDSEEGTFVNPYLNPTGIIYKPRVDMAISKDSGVTWSSYVGKNLNPVGQRKNIITWNNLGASNDLTIKLRFWGSSRFVVSNGFVELY